MSMHRCGECGLFHGQEVDDGGFAPEPESAEVVEAAEVTDAAVQIAEIEAARDVELAKIGARVTEVDERDVRIAELEAEVRALRVPAPAVEPEPIIIEVPDEDDGGPDGLEEIPDEDIAPAPEPDSNPVPRQREPKRRGWFP